MIGLDTNILIQLAVPSHPKHGPTLLALDREAQGNSLLVAPQIIAEFLHVITDRRRFADPLSMPEAVEWAKEFLGNSGVQCVSPTEESLFLALSWMMKFGFGRQRVLDVQLAATLFSTGCRRVLTSNAADFETFNVFELIQP